jgi:hypothetical protein
MTRGSLRLLSATRSAGRRVHAVGELAQERLGRHVDDRVHGIEAQRVEPELDRPLQRVADEILADLIAERPIEVERVAPWRMILVDEVRPERTQIIAVGPEVVVDDVEHGGEAELVTAVDESLERCRTAVRILRRVREHAVVAPVAFPRELCDGHELDGRDAELRQLGQSLCGGVEGALRSEAPDVQLVDHVLLERQACPVVAAPVEIRGYDSGRSVHAVGLAARGRIGQRGAVVQPPTVTRTGVDVSDDRGVIAAPLRLQRDTPIVRVQQPKLDAVCVRRPDAERTAVIAERQSTQHVRELQVDARVGSQLRTQAHDADSGFMTSIPSGGSVRLSEWW